MFVGVFLWYDLFMAIDWTSSAAKHGISRDDALHAMIHAEASDDLDGGTGEALRVFVGHPHAQTERYIEVIAAVRPPRGLLVFHVMELSDLYRYLLNEGEKK